MVSEHERHRGGRGGMSMRVVVERSRTSVVGDQATLAGMTCRSVGVHDLDPAAISTRLPTTVGLTRIRSML